MTNETSHAADSRSSISTRGHAVGEHTPGPWHVSVGELCGHAEVGVDDENDNFICTMHAIPARQNYANARLIAAAPELLAALQGAIRVADRKTVEFDAARHAIAKATGAA